MSVTYSGNSSCCASCRGQKKVHGSPHSKLTGNIDLASIRVYTCRVSCFPFFWHVLQLKVAHVLSCLSKNIQRSYKQRGYERFLAAAFPQSLVFTHVTPTMETVAIRQLCAPQM